LHQLQGSAQWQRLTSYSVHPASVRASPNASRQVSSHDGLRHLAHVTIDASPRPSPGQPQTLEEQIRETFKDIPEVELLNPGMLAWLWQERRDERDQDNRQIVQSGPTKQESKSITTREQSTHRALPNDSARTSDVLHK